MPKQGGQLKPNGLGCQSPGREGREKKIKLAKGKEGLEIWYNVGTKGR